MSTGVYNEVLPTFRPGSVAPLQTDSNGRLLVVVSDGDSVQNSNLGAINETFILGTSAEGDNDTVVHDDACTLYKLSCYNTGPAGLRIGIFDLNRDPVEGDTPKWVVYLSGQAQGGEQWDNGLALSTGLAFEIMPEIEGQSIAGVVEALNIGYRVF